MNLHQYTKLHCPRWWEREGPWDPYTDDEEANELLASLAMGGTVGPDFGGDWGASKETPEPFVKEERPVLHPAFAVPRVKRKPAPDKDGGQDDPFIAPEIPIWAQANLDPLGAGWLAMVRKERRMVGKTLFSAGWVGAGWSRPVQCKGTMARWTIVTFAAKDGVVRDTVSRCVVEIDWTPRTPDQMSSALERVAFQWLRSIE